MIRRRVIVTGLVQGVFFRDTCRREARRRGVAGWVRNRSDGAVEAVFEGDAPSVEGMLEWSRRGPRGARVDEVRTFNEPPEGAQGFSVH